MLLVDTSVWIDHLHATEPTLVAALERTDVHQHPMVLGELALGTLADRTVVLRLLSDLPAPRIASHDEVLHLVSQRHLYGRGRALVDAHLLASALLTPGLRLWTRDRRLQAAATSVGVPCLIEG
jgi:predicted nucleic acid-binding protein